MIYSMTGYGSSTVTSDNYKITVELKSLNSKYFELILKFPRVYMKYENDIRNILSKKLTRGKIVLLLNVEVLSTGKRSLNINKALAETYLVELNHIQKELNLSGEIDLPLLVSLPEILPTEVENEDEEEWNLIWQATQKAGEQLLKSREDEGNALNADLALRVQSIGKALQDIQGLAPQRIAHIRSRLNKALDEMRNKVKEVNDNRLEQELIFYLEKLDINEEVVRLSQHLKYFDELRNAESSNGKKLQFLSQEMGREINTIGSKANDASIQRLVVVMKDELEKIKEQVLNIV